MKKRSLPKLDPYAPLSARELIELSGIEEEARTLATQALPAKDQRALSMSETLALEHVEARKTARNTHLDAEIEAIKQGLTDLPDERTDRNLKHLEEHVDDKIMDVFATHAPVIRKTIAAERNANAEYKSFRDEHKLHKREPVYPLSTIMHFASVAVVGLVEAGANMFMFFGASSSGLLGAFITALCIAGCNIGLAVFAGLVPLRYLNLPAKSLRYWAVPTLTFAAVLIFAINVFAAHYRELAAHARGHFDERTVLSHVLEHPLQLSLQSYALFVFGLLFAIFAAYKGYSASDTYPGFAAPHRRWTDTVDDVDYVRQTILGGLEAVRSAEVVYVADKPLVTRTLIEALSKSQTALTMKALQAHEQDERDARAVLAALHRFRTLNIAIRTDGVTPAYFADEVEFQHGLERRDAAAALADNVAAAAAANLKHTEKFLNLITKLLRHIETAKDRCHTIMAAIEKSHVDEDALPDLADIRRLIANSLTADEGDSTCTSQPANAAARPTAAASSSSPPPLLPSRAA